MPFESRVKRESHEGGHQVPSLPSVPGAELGEITSVIRLHVAPVHCSITEHDLLAFFGRFSPGHVSLRTGYAFVEIRGGAREASEAIRTLNGKSLKGTPVTVDYDYRAASFHAPVTHCVRIEHLPALITWRDLKSLMGVIGDVRFVGLDSIRREA